MFVNDFKNYQTSQFDTLNTSAQRSSVNVRQYLHSRTNSLENTSKN